MDFAALDDVSACLFSETCEHHASSSYVIWPEVADASDVPSLPEASPAALILKSARLLFASSMIAFASGCKSRRSRVRKNGAIHRPKAKSDQTRHNQGPELHALGREVHRIQKHPSVPGRSAPSPSRSADSGISNIAQQDWEKLVHAPRVLRPCRSRDAHLRKQVPRIPDRSPALAGRTPCPMRDRSRAAAVHRASFPWHEKR